MCIATCLTVGSHAVKVQAAEDDTLDPGYYTCGETATWSYQEDTKTLTIKGSGTVKKSAYWSDIDFQNLVIEEGITEIGGWVFDGNKTITKVSLPDSLKVIGECAFARCKNLVEISFPDSVNELGDEVFYYCTNLSKVKLSNSLESLPKLAFYQCSSLKQVTIPSGIKKIGTCCFQNSGIQSIVVPATLENIGVNVFEGCKNLASVNYYAKRIPPDTFYGCTALKEVELCDDLEYIGSYAFGGCIFEKLSIPDSVTEMGKYAIISCDKLKELTLPKGLKSIPGQVANGKNLDTIVVPKGVTTIGSYAFENSYARHITLPSTITSIGRGAFKNTINLEYLKIPDKVSSIEYETFLGSHKLHEVDFGKGVKIIRYSAFEGCKNLGEITIPGKVETIEMRAFYGSSLTKVVCSKGVKKLGYSVFKNCSKLKKIYLSATVTSLECNSFSLCDSLQSFVVNSKNPKYSSKNGVLYNKKQTKLINYPSGRAGTFKIPKGVKKLSTFAFYRCRKLSGFTVDSKNKYFSAKDGVLYNHGKTKLICYPTGKSKTIRIPNSVGIIQDYAFSYAKVSKIIWPKNIRYIGYCSFEHCDKLSSITIPKTIVTVGRAAFLECKNLVTVKIASGVVIISDKAFHRCEKLKSVTIPASVVSISKNAFTYYNTCKTTFYVKKNSYGESYAKSFSSSKNYNYVLI